MIALVILLLSALSTWSFKPNISSDFLVYENVEVQEKDDLGNIVKTKEYKLTQASIDQSEEPPWYDNILNIFIYYASTAFFIPQETVKTHSIPIAFWAKAQGVIIITLLVLSGFAIRRKFRT